MINSQITHQNLDQADEGLFIGNREILSTRPSKDYKLGRKTMYKYMYSYYTTRTENDDSFIQSITIFYLALYLPGTSLLNIL